MTLQIPALPKQYIYFLFGAVIIMAVAHDFFQSSLLHYHFYVSESLLFKACWLPFLLLGFNHRHKYAWVVLTFLHVLLFALIVHIGSAIFFDHTYSFWGLMKKAVAEDLYKYLLVYGLLSFQKVKKPLEQLIIKNGKQQSKVPVDEIYFICADAPYIAVHTKEKKHLCSLTLKALEQDLPENFVRIHRSTIINVTQVDTLISRLNGDYDVKLNCGITLRLSRMYSHDLRQRFNA